MIMLTIANTTDTRMLIFKRDLKAFVRSWVGFPPSQLWYRKGFLENRAGGVLQLFVWLRR